MSTKRTALTRLTTLFHSYDARGNDLALDEAQQGLLADILSFPEMQDEPRSDKPSLADADAFTRNELRAELREAYKDYFMGNGGDMGSSQDNTTPTAQGHEAGNLSAGGTI